MGLSETRPGYEFDRGFRPSGGGPGWRRFQERGAPTRYIDASARTLPSSEAGFSVGERCFHQKFGMGRIREVDGDKLTIAFDKAGEKRVVAAFVSRP